MTLRAWTSEQENAYEAKCHSLGITYRPAQTRGVVVLSRIEERRAKRQADRGEQAMAIAVELGVSASDWQHLGWIRANAPSGIDGEPLKEWVESQVEPHWRAPKPVDLAQLTEPPKPLTAAELHRARREFDQAKVDRLNSVDPAEYAKLRAGADLPPTTFRTIPPVIAPPAPPQPEPPKLSARELRYRAQMAAAGIELRGVR